MHEAREAPKTPDSISGERATPSSEQSRQPSTPIYDRHGEQESKADDVKRVKEIERSLEATDVRSVEKVPESNLLNRKLLITRPFQVIKDGTTIAWNKVPAVFFVEREDPYWMYLLDSRGRSVGKIESESSIEPAAWNSRLAWTPQRASNGREAEIFGSLDDAKAHNPTITVTERLRHQQPVFPVLDMKVLNGQQFLQIGRPVPPGVSVSMRFPGWVNVSGDRDGWVTGRVGMLVSKPEVEQFQSHLDFMIELFEQKRIADPANREAGLHSLTELKRALWLLVTGQRADRNILAASEEDVLRCWRHILPGAEDAGERLPGRFYPGSVTAMRLSEADFRFWFRGFRQSNDELKRVLSAWDTGRIRTYDFWNDGRQEQLTFVDVP